MGAQLATLLPGLDAARRAGVALLTVGETSADSDERVLGSWFDPDLGTVGRGLPEAARDERMGTGTPLSLLMVEALRGQNPRDVAERQEPRHGVLDDLVVRRIREAGYAVPRAMVVVWVAAAAHSRALVTVTRKIRAALASEGVDGWVLLALPNMYPRDPERHARQASRCHDQEWETLLVGKGAEAPLATYAYLFEAHGEHGTFWEGAHDVPFAAAEAIFVLSASGITTTHQFEETLRKSLPQMVRHPYERLSGIGTSRLTFPRAQVEQFSAYRLGAGILREWARSRAVSIPLVAQHQRQAAARTLLTEMRRKIHETKVEALRRGGRPSPRLSAEALARARGLSRPVADDGLIFRHFSAAETRRLDDGRLSLPERLRAQRAKAEEGFPVWKSLIRQGWERYGQEMERRIAGTADELVLEGPEGVAEARAYTEELKHHLTVERETLARRREEREVGYERFLTGMESATHGPWERTAPGVTTSIVVEEPLPLASAAITQPRTPVLASLPLTLGEVDAEPPAPSREEDMLAGLAVRYAWHEERVPRIGALVGVGLMMVPPWVLLAQALLPRQWMSGLWSTLILTLAIIALAVIVSLGYYDLRTRRVTEAASDMRRVYRRMFAYRCERHEDARREALLVGVQARVRRMMDRLADWDTFATRLAEGMETEARRIEEQLFNGAIGRRDVVIANRQRLHPDDYTLHHLDEDISMRRRAQPREGFEWHASPSTMLPPLREHLRGQISLMGSPLESIHAPVRDFSLAVVKPYISGDISDLGAALEAMPAGQAAGLFDHLMERSTILYRPVDPPRTPVSFVAARDEHHMHVEERSQAAGMVMLSLE
ncbi:MAG: hypothetical protein IVW57_10510, partial [Ktedonobacterales bacterium]|nr:hypothetical protein [Ktedonobacterales bacterium]